jgi:hypothetical protein
LPSVVTRLEQYRNAKDKFRGEYMCPACIESTALIVAGAGSVGGVLAACIGKFRKLFTASGLGLFQKTKGEIIWQQAK